MLAGGYEPQAVRTERAGVEGERRMWQTLIKAVITLGIVLGCTALGKKWPSLAGLIATMPLTALLVLIWLNLDTGGDNRLMQDYTRGVIWGIVPSILFFVVAYVCFRRQLSLPVVLVISYAVWIVGAVVHQKLLG